jgi:alpha-soluble NSF attachment protein
MAASRGKLLEEEVEALERKRPLFSKHKHHEKTADKMTQCANAFRAERDFVAAGEMYMRAAHLYHELDDFTSATKTSTDSARMYAKDPTRHTETMASLHFAIDLYKSKDKRMEAAGLLADLAKVMAEESDLDGAVQALQEASDLYKEARAEAKAASVLESVADLLAEKGEFVGSARFLREVAHLRLANQLTQGASAEVFFKAILVQLQTNDLVGARTELDAYLRVNPVFQNNQYCKFLLDILRKIEKHDIEGYDEAVELFKERNVCDQWLTYRLIDLRKYADPEGDGIL